MASSEKITGDGIVVTNTKLRPAISYEVLARKLLTGRSRRRGIVIGVEGFMGSGKTTLAKRLGATLNAPVISLDRYVAIRRGNLAFSSRIAHAKLSKCFFKNLQCARRLIVEGICLQAVMRHLRIRPAATVYMKRVSDMGLWHDGLNLDSFQRNDSFDFEREEPRLSDNLYHQKYLPHKMAHFIIERQENENGDLTAAPTRPHIKAKRSRAERRWGFMK